MSEDKVVKVVPPEQLLIQKLVAQMEKLNENIERQNDLLDEICAHHEVVSVAAGILSDVAGNGKRIDSKDIVAAINSAVDEVFGDDDDDGDDGEEEPEFAGPSPKRGSRD